MNRRSFSSKFLKLGLLSSCFSNLPWLAAAIRPQVSNRPPSGRGYEIKLHNLTVHLDREGQIAAADIGPRKLRRALSGGLALEGCKTEGPVAARRLESRGLEFSSKMRNPDKREFRVVQRFLPAQGSVRWEVEIISDGEPWTVPITTKLRWPAAEGVRIWAPWVGRDDEWDDPLESQPLSRCYWPCTFDYGPYAGIGGFCIPMASFLEAEEDTGLSLVLSPEDSILELKLTTDAEGTLAFRRLNNRLGQGRTTNFAMDLVPHEADWRGGLRWMVQRYEPFFDPPNPKASEMAGTGAYSGWDDPIDAGRLKRMAFSVLWEAAFDWPYLGMYFPPLDENETWWSAGYNSVGDHIPDLVKRLSYSTLNDRARTRSKEGFYYLSYFTFDGWGWKDVYSINVIDRNLPQKYWWTDPVTYLREKAADGIWRDELGRESIIEGLVVMDGSGPDYQADILDQVRREIEKIPDSAGLAVDRIWWGINYTKAGGRPINYGADDIVGWYYGRPGRYHSVSFKDTLSKLGPLLHGAGKVIFYNPCMSYRLDLMREVDGFFGEIWPTVRGYTSLNGTGLMALRKPGIVWTSDSSSLKPDPDAYFQRHLHMGVYPMVPFPKNDHSINPDPWAEQFYLDYGLLMAAMRGKKWVLEPHCIKVSGGTAKANLFEVPGGWVAPITFGPKDGTIEVILQNLPGLVKSVRCEALVPGVEQPQTVVTTFQGGKLRLHVPLRRGCSMLRVVNAG